MLKTYGVQDKVTLFYNDYNTYFNTQKVLDLVSFINKDEPEKICGGIGMQSHVDVKVPTVSQYGAALEKFLAAGYEIQILPSILIRKALLRLILMWMKMRPIMTRKSLSAI